MAENIKQIAVRIRTLREISGESVAELAKLFKLELSEYAGFESGETDIPVSFLYEVAGHYKVELTALLTGGEPHRKAVSLVRAGTGPGVQRRSGYQYRDMAFNFAHKKMEVFEVVTGPREKIGEEHYNTHPGQEYNYCLEGSMKVYIENNEYILNPGDSLYFDSGQRHAMAALNNKPAKFLAVIL
jgi:quercetin dioxygenase-like cupin family protein